MATLALKNIYKIYEDEVTAVSNFNLEIKDKEFIVFVGPSGCGKSTTLRMIAGLEEISKGDLFIGDQLVTDVEPKDRDIAMVFQNYALYPHMSIYDNMAFALKLRKFPKKEIDEKIREVAKILDIEALLDRKPKALSGGQRQRVALGRAIVRQPKVFLMDEPLSNLDAKLRVQMRAEITKLHKRLGTTFIYVTHDQTEAMTMGTRIVVMNKGILQQVDTPQNIYNYPKNKFVASFIGSPQMNFFNGIVIKNQNTVAMLGGNEKITLLPEQAKYLMNSGYFGREVILGVRPENISLVPKTTRDTKLTGVIDMVELMGAESYIYVKIAEEMLVVRINGTTTKTGGEIIDIYLNPDQIHLVDRETEERMIITKHSEQTM